MLNDCKKCSLTLLSLICYLAYSAFVYTFMKLNATCSRLILSFHHTQKITVVLFKGGSPKKILFLLQH